MFDAEYLRDNSDIIEKLKAIPALGTFEDKDIRGLLRLSEIRNYNAGDLIIEEGSYGGWTYYLISGKVKIVKNGRDLFTLQRTGDVFGEMGVIECSSRSASVYAVVDTSCVVIDITDIDGLSMESRFAFRYIIFKEFAEILANRLRITTEEYIRKKEEIERLNLARRLISTTEELMQAREEIDQLKAKIKHKP